MVAVFDQQVLSASATPDNGNRDRLLDRVPESGRSASTLELRRLCDGTLAGMFDGPTTAGVDFSAPLVVVDLSAVYHSPALPEVMTCVAAWLQTALG
jgi:hypothetical protein